MIKQQKQVWKLSSPPIHHSSTCSQVPEEVRRGHMFYIYVWQYPYISIYVHYSKYYYKELNVTDSSMILTTIYLC